MVLIRRYNSADRSEWNSFVGKAKNSTFLFDRSYVDYHEDRFRDHSLLIYSDNKLKALFIANENNDRIESHGGLTYGGLILEPGVRLEEVLQYFYHLLLYYHSNGFKTVFYKCVPSFFTIYSSNEDLYALFLLEATLTRRDAFLVLEPGKTSAYQTRRKRALKKAQTAGYSVRRSSDPDLFWSEVLEPNLESRFGAKPVHSASEIKLLMDRFPEQIQLYELFTDKVSAGIVVFLAGYVVHTQYISATDEAKKNGLMDALVHELVNETFANMRIVSFGTSNGIEPRTLNRGVFDWKEGFGARTHVQDFYEFPAANYLLLKEYE